MNGAVPVLGLVCASVGCAMLIPGWRLVRGTTLVPAWFWLAAALLSLMAANAAGLSVWQLSPAWKSAGSGFAATMLLTPLVAILGARSPGYRAWQWFVVLPLVLVLQWPSLTQLVGSSGREPLSLGAPAITGFLLVTMMSAGTYAGTASATPVLFYVAGVILLFAPGAGWVAPGDAPPALAALLIVLGLVLGVNAGTRTLRMLEQPGSRQERLNALWSAFRSAWGFAWSSRVQDRVNQFAAREHWTVQLTSQGFRRSDGTPADDAELDLPMEGFRWVLSRFLSEVRLAELLNTGASSSTSDLPASQQNRSEA